MKSYFYFILMLCFSQVWAQETGSIKGLVTDSNGLVLPGATVQVQNSSKGVVTNADGKFTLTNLNVGSTTIVASYVGFSSQTKSVIVVAGTEVMVNFSLEESAEQLDEVIVSLNKKPQKLTEVPATVSIIRAKDIQEFSSFNLGELASRQKGVDFVRSGVLGTGINIRGFNSAFNPKNLQVTDDRLQSLIATGLPFGSFSTVIKEDVERVEILLGPNGTLYGPNAHNGLVSSVTKNPFTSEGTTFALGGGSQNVLSARLRHAQKVSDKFAYKFHFERSQGTEFNYVDTVYVGTVGYSELDLDRDFSSQKYGAGIHFKPTTDSEIIGYYGHSNNNNIGVTNAGRNQIKDWQIHEFQLKYVSPHVFLNTYYTMSKTDDTYAMNQRTQNYVSFINAGFSEAEARERSFNEQWVPAFGIAIPRGALFRDASNRFNAEGQYNNNWNGFQLTAGAQFQRDMADSKNTYLLDFDGPININQFGVYSQLEYGIKEAGLNFLLGGRVDNHDLYGSNFLPKAAITKNMENGTWRLTYGKGMAVPSILNLKGNLFGGLILGNGEGFTLSNGTKIEKLKVETINTFEAGYKGKLAEKLFIDANAYYNISENFISPLRTITDAANGVVVTQVGDKPIGEVVPGSNGAFVLTYSNFGKVDTYGVDLGLNYYFDDSWRLTVNYSYFGRYLDKNDLRNDGNLDGRVLETELPINTPEHKIITGVHYNKGNFYGAMYGRWIQRYDFFSGINIAAKTQDTTGDGVNDVIEGARNGRTWNYGQLGGFTVDANFGYNFSNGLTVGANVTNLFNAQVREFVASPVIGTLISVEMRYHLDFFKKSK